jgi:hypothetical protein
MVNAGRGAWLPDEVASALARVASHTASRGAAASALATRG